MKYPESPWSSKQNHPFTLHQNYLSDVRLFTFLPPHLPSVVISCSCLLRFNYLSCLSKYEKFNVNLEYYDVINPNSYSSSEHEEFSATTPIELPAHLSSSQLIYDVHPCAL